MPNDNNIKPDPLPVFFFLYQTRTHPILKNPTRWALLVTPSLDKKLDQNIAIFAFG